MFSIISSLLWISHLWLDGTFHASSLPLSLTIVCMETDISFLHYRTCGSPSMGTCALNWQRKDCVLLKNLKALTTYLLQTLLSDGAELLVSCGSVEALKSLWRAQFSAETSGSFSEYAVFSVAPFYYLLPQIPLSTPIFDLCIFSPKSHHSLLGLCFSDVRFWQCPAGVSWIECGPHFVSLSLSQR